MKIQKPLLFLLFSGLLVCGVFLEASAQGQQQIVQFSGVVVGEDSLSGVPGVHIYVPKAGRGTTSNQYGYFSMPVMEADSVVISAVGFTKQFFIIPEVGTRKSVTVAITLESDTTFLPAIDIFPFPTEELFKEAVLALELPPEYDNNRLRKNMSEDILAQMYRDLPMTGSMNFRNYNNQQFDNMHGRASAGFYNPLLNPFKWAQFIKSIKRGDFKKK